MKDKDEKNTKVKEVYKDEIKKEKSPEAPKEAVVEKTEIQKKEDKV